MSSFRGKILVIRGGAIGDFILTLPAVAALRHQFPGAGLEVLGYPHIVQLAVAGGLVDSVRSIDARPLAGFFARNGELAEDLATYFSDFDVIISYLYDPDEIFQINVRRCAPCQFIAGPHRPEEEAKIHAARVYLKPLERLAIFDADPVPRLSFDPVPLEASPLSGPFLAVHPGSGSEKKNWPEGRWAELVEWLVRETHYGVLIVGGEAEGDRLQRLAAPLPPDRVRLAQSLPLPELGARLQTAAGFIGHDSGISHLAAALGRPCLVLWGDTSDAVWRPLGPRVTVLRDPGGLMALEVPQVIAQVEHLWRGQRNVVCE
jgi:heptosyltransferase III